MKLTELNQLYLKKYLQRAEDDSDFNERENYTIELDKNNEIPEEITQFIAKFDNKEIINKEEFLKFSDDLSKLDINVQECISYLLFQMSQSICFAHQKAREEIIKDIENNVKAGQERPQSAENTEKYSGLLNSYHFFEHFSNSITKYYHHNFLSYPGIINSQADPVHLNLLFDINALRLVGKLPKTPNYHGFDLSKPFHPIPKKLEVVVQNEKIPLRKGVKSSGEYYPYRMANKLVLGETGDNTFMATNGTKILFIRGVERYTPNAVLASKIARVVSSIHFSSERLLDNRLVGSRGIAGYALSVADGRISDARKKYIEEEKRVFPGSGIINEVTSFINEGDVNTENFGLSSEKMDEAHLSKIDFDRCDISSPITKEDYERNLLQPIYRNVSSYAEDREYIKETLFARLKLSMLTKPLISKLADKAFTAEDSEHQKEAIEELTNRSNIALELFLEHPNVKSYLRENPSVFDQCYDEIVSYISTHFEEDDKVLLQSALTKRVDNIHKKVKDELNIILPSLNQKKSDFVEPHPIHRENTSTHSNAPETEPVSKDDEDILLSQIFDTLTPKIQGLRANPENQQAQQAQQALKVVENLSIQLKNAMTNYTNDKSNKKINKEQAKIKFINTCTTEINRAKSLLKKELGWGDFLTNLLKKLANVVIGATNKTVRVFGAQHQFTLFKPAEPPLLSDVEKVEKALNEASPPPPKK